MIDNGNDDVNEEYKDIQIRTITEWMNIKLKQNSVNVINKDFKDGTKLLELLFVISKDPEIQFHCGSTKKDAITNVSTVLSFLKKKHSDDSNFPSLSLEDILNGDFQSTLALLFFIMLKYQFTSILQKNKVNFLSIL
ncbi:calponin homology domain-containing protein [Sporodiniella umbellata]|nr:calponin homology domain-containing protein [Sporodiniella umbellata]